MKDEALPISARFSIDTISFFRASSYVRIRFAILSCSNWKPFWMLDGKCILVVQDFNFSYSFLTLILMRSSKNTRKLIFEKLKWTLEILAHFTNIFVVPVGW